VRNKWPREAVTESGRKEKEKRRPVGIKLRRTRQAWPTGMGTKKSKRTRRPIG
jgi:hypothetical protein